jgi:hypothetical protein
MSIIIFEYRMPKIEIGPFQNVVCRRLQKGTKLERDATLTSNLELSDKKEVAPRRKRTRTAQQGSHTKRKSRKPNSSEDESDSSSELSSEGESVSESTSRIFSEQGN